VGVWVKMPLSLVSLAALGADVFVMRHCARSTFLPDLQAPLEFVYLANYSDGGELPDWGVAPTLCTARGRQIVQGEGKALSAAFARFSAPTGKSSYGRRSATEG